MTFQWFIYTYFLFTTIIIIYRRTNTAIDTGDMSQTFVPEDWLMTALNADKLEPFQQLRIEHDYAITLPSRVLVTNDNLKEAPSSGHQSNYSGSVYIDNFTLLLLMYNDNIKENVILWLCKHVLHVWVFN